MRILPIGGGYLIVMHATHMTFHRNGECRPSDDRQHGRNPLLYKAALRVAALEDEVTRLQNELALHGVEYVEVENG